MKYVVIVKTQADIGPSKQYPPCWPRECEEFDSYEDAVAKYPNRIPMDESHYAAYARGLDLVHAQMIMPKPGFFKRLFGG